jgi:hypothetical protein
MLVQSRKIITNLLSQAAFQVSSKSQSELINVPSSKYVDHRLELKNNNWIVPDPTKQVI